jgi:hypothetical protein
MYVRGAGPSTSAGGYSPSGWGFSTRGMGSTESVTAATIASSGLSTTASLLVAFSVVTGPVGAAIAAVGAVAVLLVKVFQGCGATCVQATQYANQVEAALKQNLQAYLSSPVRTVSMQAAAVNNYNTGIAALQQACGQAALGQAGVNCIDQRVNASSCQWKASPGGWVQASDRTCTYTPWGAAGSGSSCWNWVIGYLDPIQNDPCVQPDSVLTAGGSSTSILSGASGTVFGISTPLAIGGLLLAAWLLGGD